MANTETIFSRLTESPFHQGLATPQLWYGANKGQLRGGYRGGGNHRGTPQKGKETEIYPIIRGTLPEFQIQSKLGGRLKYFWNQWKVLTNDEEILKIVKGWNIPLIHTPQETHTSNSSISRMGQFLIDQEISAMINKGAIQKTSYKTGQVLQACSSGKNRMALKGQS